MQEQSQQHHATEIAFTQRMVQEKSQQETATRIVPTQLQIVTKKHESHDAVVLVRKFADREEENRASHSERMHEVRQVETEKMRRLRRGCKRQKTGAG